MRLPIGFTEGGAGLVAGHGVMGAGGKPVDLTQVLNAIGASYASATALKDVGPDFQDGIVLVGDTPFAWNAASTVNDPTDQLTIRPSAIDAAAPGRWVYAAGPQIVLSLPWTFATADAAVLFTTPTGVVLRPRLLWWTVDTTPAGGSSPTIGVSSNKTGFTAKGSLLGGAAGDGAGTLLSAVSPLLGTRGTRAGDDRLIRENVPVATAAATPSFAIEQLLYAATIGTGAAGVKTALINGGTPGVGEAAPDAPGTTVVFNAETTGTGTADLWYLTNVGVSIVNSLWVAGNNIRFDRIEDLFTSGAGAVNVLADIIQL